MTYVIVAAIVGASLVTGLLFAFSNFVMSALRELPNESGMLTMQRINEKIINPIFLSLFLGTPVLCVIIAIKSVMNLGELANLYLLIGSICYLAGPFIITMLFNVPLNNRLAKAAALNADEVWPDYQVCWQRWNHVRTYIGILSILMLAVGLGNLDV
jgi:uncharacterized membrane protein